MRPSPEVYDAWARLLEYPAWEAGDVAGWCRRIAAAAPDATADLAAFERFAVEHERGQLEEAYTRTFDGNIERALEVGWHLFGENYARGAFLVRMRKLLREVGWPENSELPDHLTNVLPALGRAQPQVADAIVRGSVVPALRRIELGFGAEDNPWKPALSGLRRFLELTHAPQPAVAP